MPLVDVALAVVDAAPPARVATLLAEADRRIDAFVEARLDRPVIGFVPSDLQAIWPVLAAIRRGRLAPGSVFCEWGSGFGVAACIASMVGFDACGIEIVEDLVDAARELARDFDLPVEYVCGSFLPEGAEDVVDVPNEFSWLETGGISAYEELELDIDDFDVVFAYPWPGEEKALTELFERYAAVGALLVTYRGLEAMHVQRKVTGPPAG